MNCLHKRPYCQLYLLCFLMSAVLFIAEFDVSRVVLDDFLPQPVSVNMCIDFSSSNTLMTQHGLYSSQIGSSLQQMGCKGMAEGVRTDFFCDAGFVGQLFDEVENHDA